MKYFIDTEFIEGFKNPLLGKRRHFIDLISIGIISDDSREYYAISNRFDFNAAWNAYQLEQVSGDQRNIFPNGKKVYWLRVNVLKPIWKELRDRYLAETNDISDSKMYSRLKAQSFELSSFMMLVNHYGKSNKQIAVEITEFVLCPKKDNENGSVTITISPKPKFYGYYADYDWVLFCSLFGRMIDLPSGFPMYCHDLKQTLDEKVGSFIFNKRLVFDVLGSTTKQLTLDEKIEKVKLHPSYPKQSNEHNALADARWNKELYNFLQTI